jgi:hypothetical protein
MGQDQNKNKPENTEKTRRRPANPFPKGIGGNPHGRPKKGETLTDILREAGEVAVKGIPRRKLIADKLWKLAVKGNLKAIEMVYNRHDGTPSQMVKIGSDGESLPVVVIKYPEEVTDDSGKNA